MPQIKQIHTISVCASRTEIRDIIELQSAVSYCKKNGIATDYMPLENRIELLMFFNPLDEMCANHILMIKEYLIKAFKDGNSVKGSM